MRVQSIIHYRPASGMRSLAAAAAVALLGAFMLPMAGGGAEADSGMPGTRSAWPDTSIRGASEDPAASEAVVTGAARSEQGLINPVKEGRVTLRWGEAVSPFTGKVQHHNGVDLGAKKGTLVCSAARATVEVATDRFRDTDAWGLVVVLDHGNGVKTLYAHLGEILVEVGEKVEQGQPIAKVGSTGLSTGPHVHLEVWRDGEPQDPALLIPDLGHATKPPAKDS